MPTTEYESVIKYAVLSTRNAAQYSPTTYWKREEAEAWLENEIAHSSSPCDALIVAQVIVPVYKAGSDCWRNFTPAPRHPCTPPGVPTIYGMDVNDEPPKLVKTERGYQAVF